MRGLNWSALCLCLLCFASGQKVYGQAPTKQKRSVLAPIDDVAGLPRVLLIGDSISMGYTLEVRRLLRGKANIHRPPVNCGPTTRGLQQIDKWLGQKKWDVIHFNWGLHDLKYLGPNGENLADPHDKSSIQQVSPSEYAKNLQQLVQRLKKTDAQLIWRNTTPVPPGAKGRVVGDSVRYNKIAAAIMKKHDVPIHDLYAFVMKQQFDLQRKADVHFTADGNRQLAQQVANEVAASLRKVKSVSKKK